MQLKFMMLSLTCLDVAFTNASFYKQVKNWKVPKIDAWRWVIAVECHMTHFSIYVAVESWHQKQVQNQNAVEHAHTIMPQNCVAKETFIQKTVYGQAAAEVLHLMLNSFCVALQIKFHPREEQTQDAVEPKVWSCNRKMLSWLCSRDWFAVPLSPVYVTKKRIITNICKNNVEGIFMSKLKG